jgi:hypothetical protein
MQSRYTFRLPRLGGLALADLGSGTRASIGIRRLGSTSRSTPSSTTRRRRRSSLSRAGARSVGERGCRGVLRLALGLLRLLRLVLGASRPDRFRITALGGRKTLRAFAVLRKLVPKAVQDVPGRVDVAVDLVPAQTARENTVKVTFFPRNVHAAHSSARKAS